VHPFQEASTFRTLADDYLIPGREATLLKAQYGHFPQKYTLLSLFRINCYAKHIPAYLGNIDEATGKTSITLSGYRAFWIQKKTEAHQKYCSKPIEAPIELLLLVFMEKLSHIPFTKQVFFS
jgi:hypothetical protein